MFESHFREVGHMSLICMQQINLKVSVKINGDYLTFIGTGNNVSVSRLSDTIEYPYLGVHGQVIYLSTESGATPRVTVIVTERFLAAVCVEIESDISRRSSFLLRYRLVKCDAVVLIIWVSVYVFGCQSD